MKQAGRGSQLRFDESLTRREGCRAPGSMGLSSAGSRGLMWAPVEVLVRISAERSLVELREILCRVLRQDDLTIGIGMTVRRAVAAPW